MFSVTPWQTRRASRRRHLREGETSICSLDEARDYDSPAASFATSQIQRTAMYLRNEEPRTDSMHASASMTDVRFRNEADAIPMREHCLHHHDVQPSQLNELCPLLSSS